MSKTIKGYKVFNPDWTCRGFQYKVGETFTHNGNIEMCGKRFHFCRKASDCFNYYDFDSKNKVAEVEAIGVVETQGDKSVTDKIKIVREIEWQELLTIVNEGKNCTGICNSGNRNSGDWNSGNRNSGNWNSGNWNSGNRNSGDWNSGNRNSGNRNSGDWNSGDWNSGNWNSGNRNSGNRNSGDWNSGDWNSTDYSTGFFNSEQQPIYMFNKPIEMQRNDIHDLKGLQILDRNYENSWWIYADNMSAKEKAAHPEYEITGGYLKTVDFKTACKMMWENLDEDEKASVIALPNFDADVFETITGIRGKELIKMQINEYQQAAMRTASGMNYENHGMLMNAALGICGEGGEVADLVKKATFQGHDLDKEHIAKELGDVAWYIAVGAQAIGYDLETIMQMNVDKLKARYPDGFSAEKSLHRKEGDI